VPPPALAGEVVPADIDAVQLEAAKTVLDGIGCGNVRYVCNDALAQETEGAPFDAVYVGGSVGRVPETLKRQLKDGGRMAGFQCLFVGSWAATRRPCTYFGE